MQRLTEKESKIKVAIIIKKSFIHSFKTLNVALLKLDLLLIRKITFAQKDTMQQFIFSFYAFQI